MEGFRIEIRKTVSFPGSVSSVSSVVKNSRASSAQRSEWR
jgi:hypothetical protein